MKKPIEQLTHTAPVITDGAWGTQLQQAGLSSGECPDIWNIKFPDRVERVGRAYVEAGSQVILTNTFRSNRISLKDYGLDELTYEINLEGVRLSKKAAGEKIKVFASIGPTGKLLLTGEITEELLKKVFEEQAESLAEGEPDAIIVETMSDLTEAKIALLAAQKTDLPVGVSMVYDSGAKKDCTMMGVTVEQAVLELTEAGADFIGANCGRGIEDFVDICRRMRDNTHLPLWIKPNAGLPEYVDGKTVYRITPEEFSENVPALIEAGATFIGGCCGTTPEFIRELVRILAK